MGLLFKLPYTAGPYAGQTTQSVQNVSNPIDSAAGRGLFFRVDGNAPHPNFGDIQPGWYVTGHPSWRVVSCIRDPNDLPNHTYVITVNNGSFGSGVAVSFTAI